MVCNLCNAACDVQYMLCRYVVQHTWCDQCDASSVRQSLNLCGATYVVHSMWCNMRGCALYVVQSTLCDLCSKRFECAAQA
eukprot:1540748-Pyramimonas_sp.AAC.1